MATQAHPRTVLQLKMPAGEYHLELQSIFRVAGVATLEGDADGSFMGWLCYQGEFLAVFDLSQLLDSGPSTLCFGSRILLVNAHPGSKTRHVGLLVEEVTDTMPLTAADGAPLNLTSILPMLQYLEPAKKPEPRTR